MLGGIVIFISHVVTHSVFQRIFFWGWKFRLIMTAAQVSVKLRYCDQTTSISISFLYHEQSFRLNRAVR